MSTELLDLGVAWRDACAEFSKATKIDIAAEEKESDGQDIVNKLNNARTKDAESHRKIDKAKTAFGRTITAVERIGTVAAQGASMVFGSPATITMSCISFVIDAGFEYKKIAHDIDEIFDRIATMLERFEIVRDHQQVMAPAMIRVAHDLLLAVVAICGRCIHVLHRNKVGKFLAVAFCSDDGGIKDQLHVLAALENRELQMKGTLTLVAAETSKRNTAMGFEDLKATDAKILNSISQLNDSSTDKKVLDNLKEKLGVGDSTSEAEYRAYRDRLLSETCAWLKEDSQYQTWSDKDNGESSLWVLNGDSGCGKSYTLTAIIRDLLTRYPQGQHDANRVSVAYCYLTRSGKKDAQNSKTGPSIRGALREWAWEIAQNDLFYRKDLQVLFKDGSDLGDFNEIWQKLFIDHLEKQATFFLLLDGLHELEEKELDDLITLAKTLPSCSGLKIMITSRPPFVQKLRSKAPSIGPVVDLRDKAHVDMEKYIQKQADKLAIFKKATIDVEQLKAQVCSGLLEAVNGNFVLADYKLREIGSKYDPEEVKQIVERTKEGAGFSDSIVKDIQECNRTLTTREIQNLNALLLWVMYGEWSFSTKELESVLFIQQGRSSLQPLANEIRDKFSAFFDLSDETEELDSTVTLKHDSIAEYFKTLSQEQNSSDTSSVQALSKGEIRMLQNFIQKLCEQDVYERIGLGPFFDQKLSQSDTGVAVDCENAEAKIARGCLQVLNGEFSTDADDLIPYASNFLVTHLKQIDLDTVDPRVKAELGPLLVKMFKDTTAIKKVAESTIMWSYDDDGIRKVLEFFRSSAVMRKVIGSEVSDQEWVGKILNSDNPELELLEDSKRVIAELWCTEEKAWKFLRYFKCLYGRYNKVKSTESPDVYRLDQQVDENDVEVEEIQDISRMVQDLLPLEMSKPGALRNVGVTYRECGHVLEAIGQLKHALEIDPDYLLAHASLSSTYTQESKTGPVPDWEKAIHHQDIVVERVRSGVKLFSDIEPNDQLNGLLSDKAYWLRKLGRYDESCAIYNTLLQENPKNDDLRLELVFTLCEAKYYGHVVKTLQQLGQDTDEDTEENRLSRFFHTQHFDPEFHSTILLAFKKVGNMLEIQGHYRQAMNDAINDKNKQNWRMKYAYYNLTYYLAAMLHTYGGGTAEQEEAVQLWERIINMAKAENDLYMPQIFSARRLARIYIAKAAEAGRDSAVANEMFNKLQGFALAANEEDSDDNYWGGGLSRREVRSLLGRYYTRIGDVERAKEQLRPAVEVSIKLLSDEDPDNDYQAYLKLGDAFMDFNDDVNAIAAWSLIQPTEGVERLLAPLKSAPNAKGRISPVNDTKAATNSESVENKMTDDSQGRDEQSPSRTHLRRSNTIGFGRKLSGPLSYSCDGRCGTDWTYADDFYVCRECIDVQFDAPCLEKLRQGEIKRDICDKNHKFLHVPAWSLESAKRAAEDKVLVGEEVLEKDAWLDGIKKEWRISD
ncbi:MAG: hypothetical protein M1821_000739 [Bathelium mastoideum]|nr:MAG: hypothetical protein M1821_000739 [Bathelium mastoideum]